MKLNIEKENLEKLAQFVYLGNMIINGYKKTNEVATDYADFAQDIYKQIMKDIPESKLNYEFKNLPNEKSTEAKISDYCDRIYDSVQDYLQDYQNALFCDLLIEQK